MNSNTMSSHALNSKALNYKTRILGVGHTALDHLLVVDTFPVQNSKTEASSSLRQGGGPVATACVTLARLGNQVDFCALIGVDATGELLMNEFAQEGVSTDYVIQAADMTTPEATIFVERESGKRTVVLDRCGCRELTVDEVTQIPLEHYSYLLLDGKDASASLTAAAAIHSHGGKVMIDLGSLRPDNDTLISASDYCVVSRDFIIDYMPGTEAMTAALEITKRGPELAVITMGAGGVVWAADGVSGWSPAYPVTAVDTTGAGDVYHGALLHALTQEYELEQALRFAAVCAGIKCRQPGGRTGIPDLTTILSALEEWE
jgi:sulfofructose kinase